MRKSSTKYLMLSSAAFVGLVSATPALAQDASATATADTAADNSSIIIVTAQKREQNAQDVPISLVAVTGESIERQGISSLQELGNSIAGVTILAGNPGAMRLAIRGASDLSSSNQSASVNGFYLDETAMSYVPGYMPEVSLADIERVEVLRGPQGTLFGEGSEGGTLRVITRKPDSQKFFGRVKLGAYATSGGGEGYAAQINSNIPIVQDVLAVSVAGGYRNLPGWIDIPDINVKNSNTSKLSDGRFALRYTPSTDFTLDLFYQIGRSKIRDFVSTSRDELNPRAVAAQFGVGPVGGLSPSEGKLDVGALTINYDTGPATLVSASSLTTSSFDTARDLTTIVPAAFPPSFVPGATAQSIYRVRSHAFSQEIRLVSNGANALNWTVGGYFKHETRSVEDGFIFNVPAIQTIDSPLSHSDQKGDAWAVFGDIDYALTAKLSVQAGLRYFEDSKNFSVTQVRGSAFPLGFPPAGAVQSGDDSSHATSPKIGVTYKISPSALIFAKYSKGFRSGGANNAPLSTYPYATKQFGPDSLNAFELGLKTTPFAGWTVNLYAYHNDWSDLQLPFRTDDGVFTYVRNVGTAKTDGVELEVSADITPSLNLGLTYAYSNAAIDGDVTDRLGRIIVRSGSDLPLNAKNKVTAAIHYEIALSSDMQIDFDGRYRWASKTYSDPANTPGFTNQPTSQLFLSSGVKGNWGALTLFVDNVFDRDDTVAKYPPAGPPLYTYSNYLRPRNFGVEFKRSF
jgi:outer membrane receptor protein involved in Fe transport